jgi:hypothetical protein
MVIVHRLDSFVDEITDGLEQPHVFLKTDTQGYDLEVLKGVACRLLSKGANTHLTPRIDVSLALPNPEQLCS